MTTAIQDPVPLISVCMFCKRQIVAKLVPTGSKLEPAANHSHGVCRDCAPGYFKQLGLSEAQQIHLLRHVVD